MLGISKETLEQHCYYDEIILMLDIYAYNNADDDEKRRWIQYKIAQGIPVTRAEFQFARFGKKGKK